MGNKMDDNIFDRLREMGEKFPEKFNILEEQIDVKVQLEYFKQSKKIKSTLPKDFSIDDLNLEELDNEELPFEDKKILLIKIASIDDPKAFRILEAVAKNKDSELYPWAIMALQESKMLLESSILNENQVFISTGLGGRGTSLRYFVVLMGKEISEFADFQQKIIKSEFEFALNKNKSELENISFEENFVSLNVLVPFDVPFHKVFKSAVHECNQYGDFLKTNFLVTNVKTLTIKEIKDFVEKNQLPNEQQHDIDFETLDDIDDDE